MAENEVVYYQDDDVRVTNARVMLASKTYAMANITSVAARRKPANRALPVFVAVAGLAIAAYSLVAGEDAAGGAGFGILLLVVGIVLARGARDQYIVKLGGTAQAFEFPTRLCARGRGGVQ